MTLRLVPVTSTYQSLVSHAYSLLFQMHLDNAQGAYFDFGNHTEKVCLCDFFFLLKGNRSTFILWCTNIN